MQPTILIVDDESTIRRMACALLKRQGYRVLEAASGGETLELVKRDTPDLILLDIIMPGMDGFEVCRAIREHPKTAHIPVIMLSAVSDQVRDSTVKADDYISKPFTPQDLIPRVRVLIEH